MKVVSKYYAVVLEAACSLTVCLHKKQHIYIAFSLKIGSLTKSFYW